MDRDEDDIDDRYYGKGLRKASGIVQNLDQWPELPLMVESSASNKLGTIIFFGIYCVF